MKATILVRYNCLKIVFYIFRIFFSQTKTKRNRNKRDERRKRRNTDKEKGRATFNTKCAASML